MTEHKLTTHDLTIKSSNPYESLSYIQGLDTEIYLDGKKITPTAFKVECNNLKRVVEVTLTLPLKSLDIQAEAIVYNN